MRIKSMPFSIRIFLPDGDPEGVRVIDKSNWSGRGVAFPRSRFCAITERDDAEQPGVYVLVGSTADRRPALYIGEGDSVIERLRRHNSSKDFWSWGAYFVSQNGELNKAHVRYLEARLITLALRAGVYCVQNSTEQRLPRVGYADEADCESFLRDVLSILPLIGIGAFEARATQQAAPAGPTSADDTPARSYLFNRRGCRAWGEAREDGFLVKAGSQMCPSPRPSCPEGILRSRQQLLDVGLLKQQSDHLEFAEDYLFPSPSSAASVITGGSMNGRIHWRTPEGVTLKEMQEAAASA